MLFIKSHTQSIVRAFIQVKVINTNKLNSASLILMESDYWETK